LSFVRVGDARFAWTEATCLGGVLEDKDASVAHRRERKRESMDANQERGRHEVRYANGKRAYADSLEAARDVVQVKTREDAGGGWFPAEIWTAGISDVLGVGELIETVGSVVVVVEDAQ
jgi:hypothetical protein